MYGIQYIRNVNYKYIKNKLHYTEKIIINKFKYIYINVNT